MIFRVDKFENCCFTTSNIQTSLKARATILCLEPVRTDGLGDGSGSTIVL